MPTKMPFNICTYTLSTSPIIDGYKEKVDEKYQYAEHFLACIALNLSTPPEIKALLEKVDSKIVKQALAVA